MVGYFPTGHFAELPAGDGEGGDGKARQAVTTVVSVSGYGDWQGVPVELNRLLWNLLKLGQLDCLMRVCKKDIPRFTLVLGI